MFPSLAGKGIRNTGNHNLAWRCGLAVTAGGLIFVGSWSDRTVHAYDKDTGKVLWEKELDANPEGIPAVYEAGGREYIVFSARAGLNGNAASDTVLMKAGKPEAQGYVFALPRSRANQ